MPTTLTYDALKAAVTGGAAALRLTLRLEAVSPKVFPPTYEGGKYATEERIIGGQKLPCVLLDVRVHGPKADVHYEKTSDLRIIYLHQCQNIPQELSLNAVT